MTLMFRSFPSFCAVSRLLGFILCRVREGLMASWLLAIRPSIRRGCFPAIVALLVVKPPHPDKCVITSADESATPFLFKSHEHGANKDTFTQAQTRGDEHPLVGVSRSTEALV